MTLFPPGKSWRNAFLIGLALFLFTRSLTLTAFPIFNDEAIYLQYSQMIHADWASNKFISMNNQYRDWKPPLQYWMGAPAIGLGGDPLLAGRSVAFLASLAGFFGFYLFAKEFFGEREGVITAFLYVLCPPVLFHNDQFIAETFLFSTVPFVYWSLLKAMQPNKWRWAWIVIALVTATALLLFKQSGFLLLAVSGFLPFSRLRGRRSSTDQTVLPLASSGIQDWKGREFAFNFFFTAFVVIGAKLIAGAILPSEFDAARDRFNGNWVMSWRELLAFPTGPWSANLKLVGDYIGAYYSWLAVIFVSVFLYHAFRRKRLPELALAAMFFAGAIGIVFLLRGFNEYLFNTAVIATFLPLLARALTIVWDLTPVGAATLVRQGLLGLAGVMIVFWGYQIILFGISPGNYVERSTPWAAANYLKGWPTGFGVEEVVAMLEKEKRPGFIFADAQWGNPRTALEVYRLKRFPNFRIIPLLGDFSDATEARKLIELAKRVGPPRFAIFSADASAWRRERQQTIENALCETRTEVKAHPGQMPIIVCQF